MWSERWLAVCVVVLGVPGLLAAGTQAAQASTLGKTTIGALSGGGLVANRKRVNEYQLNVPASVSKMDIYLSPSGTAGSQAMEGVIYADAGGSPGALVGQSREISFSTTSPAGWVDFPLASNVTLSPGKYWLGIYTGGTSAVASYRYDLGATTRARLANNQTYAKGGASDPFGAIAWSDNNVMSLYATYTTPATWTIQSVPTPARSNGHVLGVSCASTGACTAVGSYANPSGTRVMLAERWNGSSWSVQSTPDPIGATDTSLSSVSCTSSTACTAVGTYKNSSGTRVTLAERWNSSTWSIQTTPSPTGAMDPSLNGVSCTSSTACTAVGSYNTSSGMFALAERWNGSSWSIQTTPNPTGATYSVLSSVSCTSSTACTAVGSSVPVFPLVALAERWNGTNWSIQTTHNRPADYNSLSGVSCTSSTACTATGYSASDFGPELTLAERWNGTTWSILTTPNPAGTTVSSLSGISCASSTACTAVGSFNNSSGSALTLAERWNGSSWSIQATPNPTGAPRSSLNSVSCTSSTACTAVGDSAGITLAERWNGSSWSGQSTSDPTGATDTSLSSVSCTSSTACAAVGRSYTSSGTSVTLAERWNGSSWSVQSTSDPMGATDTSLRSVSCTSSTACAAVGTYKNSSGTRVTLAERWNGSSWSIQSTPNPTGAASSSLNGVSCTSSTACIAVGGSGGMTLAERWNGSSWLIQTTPAATNSSLNSVSCTSPSACTAVGDSGGVTLAEGWNGSSWSVQTTPNPTGTPYNQLNDVSCTSSTACTAVGGDYYNGKTLAEHWDGTRWSIQTTVTPTATTDNSVLSGVSCTASTECNAVGSSTGVTPRVTLAEQWNGTSWSIRTTPNAAGATTSSLSGVSCTSTTACTAVGSFVRELLLPLAQRLA